VPEKAVVTDTHPLLFFASGDRRLSRKASAHFAACEERSALTYVPMAVLWECSLLVRRGRIGLRPSFRKFFEDLFSNPAYQPLDLTTKQVFLAEENRPNDDPFDALICAAAASLSLPLLTRDSEIEESGLVRVIW
jgi:PIN domain nuclease of toxin-antitoxin system